MRSPRKHFLPFLLFLFSTHLLNASIIEAVSSGRWDETSTWLGGTIPSSTDSVLIDGFSVYVNAISGSRTVAYLELTNADTNNDDDSELHVEGMIAGVPVTLTVTGDLLATLEDEDNDVAIYLTTGGNLIVNGNATFIRSADHSFTRRLLLDVVNNSRISIDGDFVYDYQTIACSEIRFEIVLRDDAIFNVSGASSFYQRGGNRLTLFAANNAQVNLEDSLFINMTGGVKLKFDLVDDSEITVNSNVHLKNSGSTGILEFDLDGSAKFTVDGNLKLESTGNDFDILLECENTNIVDVSGDVIMDAQTDGEILFDLEQNSRLELEGAITRIGPNYYGNFWMSPTATLLLNGTMVAQTFPEEVKSGSGSDYFELTNIILDNSVGFVLDDTLVIEDNLQLLKGNIFTDSTKILVLTESATISGASNEAFVDGPMIKLGASPTAGFEFPVGDQEVYAPIHVSRVNNSNSEIKAEFLLGDPPPWGNITSGVDNILEDQHWKLDRNSESGELQVTLNWENASELGITNVDSLVVVGLDNAGTWQNFGNGASSSSGEIGSITSGDPPPWGNLTYTLGSVSPINTLPVELLNFNAIPKAKSILIEWETGLELNTDRFEIERSIDGRNFNKIGLVNGQGQSFGKTSYSIEDNAPNTGMNYYRLKMIDNDGKFEYSPVEAVRFETNAKLMIYPNPVRNVLNIQGENFSSEPATIEVFDKNGQLLYHETISFDTGSLEIETDKIKVINQGTYFLRVTQSSQSNFMKFIKLE